MKIRILFTNQQQLQHIWQIGKSFLNQLKFQSLWIMKKMISRAFRMMFHSMFMLEY